MNKKLFWQPELSYSMIYWSIAFFIVFYGLILALENTRPYLTSNLVMAVGILFIIAGFRRSLIVEKDQLIIRYARFWKVSVINFQSIQEIEVKKSEVILTTTFSKLQLRMSKKTLQIFLSAVRSANQKHLLRES